VTRWVGFAALTLLLLVVLLLSTRASARLLDELATPHHEYETGNVPDGTDHLDVVGTSSPSTVRTSPRSTPQISESALYANVALSQGLFAAVLLAGIVLAGVPWAALGTGAGTPPIEIELITGLGVGIAIATVNVLVGRIASAFDADPSSTLRELLTPESPRGWVVLLFGVLPIVAGFEELLFRGILIGAFAVGFEISPWVLAVLSSVAFAAGHGAQGWIGIAVTGVLGLVLAAVFIQTGSLLVVIIAHYIINMVEFVVEG